MRLLLTGAGGPAAANFLDAVRLGLDPEWVVGADVSAFHLELAKVDARYLLPPAHDPEYLPAIRELCRREAIDVVHPQPDVEVAALAGADLPAATFLPPRPVVELAQDKGAAHACWQAAGVPVPYARTDLTADTLRDAIADVLARSPRAWLRAVRGAGSRASLPVSTAQQAEQWVDYWRMHRDLRAEDFMVSEFLPGAEYAWQSLWWRGQLLTSQARQRVSYLFGNLTPSGQSSSPSVAVTVNRGDVDATAEAAVRALTPQPHGVFCVDVKADDDGQPRVTEVNAGRFFTTSNFFAHAGLNMPALYLRLAAGEAPPADLVRYGPLPEGLYWVRQPDMGFALVREGAWRARQMPLLATAPR